MRRSDGIPTLAILSLFLVLACNKSASSTADSTAGTPASKTFDADAERNAVRSADALWARSVQSKNIDSLMTLYASDAWSSTGGAPAARGKDAVRKAYEGFMKTNPRDVSVNVENVDFSPDGTLAIDRGSFTATVDGPGGKRVKAPGDYLAVWKKADGRWVTISEMTNSTLPPK